MDQHTKLLYRLAGAKIRGLREQKKIPQIVLATKAGLSRSSLANIEQGRHRILLEHIFRLADVLGVDISAILPKKSELQKKREFQKSKILEDVHPSEKRWIEAIIGDDDAKDDS